MYGAGVGRLTSASGLERYQDEVFSGRLQLGVVAPRWGGYLAYARTVEVGREEVEASNAWPERWVHQEAELGVLHQPWHSKGGAIESGVLFGLGASLARLDSRPACDHVWEMFPFSLSPKCMRSSPLASASGTESSGGTLNAHAFGVHPWALAHIGLRGGPFIGARFGGGYYLPWGESAPSFLMQHDALVVAGGMF